MRSHSFIGFLTVVLALYGLINFYIIRRGWLAFKGWHSLQITYVVVLSLACLAYPLGRLWPARFLGPARSGFLTIGAFYLGFMFYLFLLVVIWDLIRLLARLISLRSLQQGEWLLPGSPAYKLSLGIILIITISIVSIGHINSLYPRLRHYEIKINKEVPEFNSLRIAVVSDLHLGSVVRLSRLKKIVNMINSLEPDLIFLVGDMMDEAVTSSQMQAAASIWLKLKARLAIVASPGNHETYSDKEKCLEEITNGYIRVLADEKMVVNNNLVIIGRRDRTVESMGGKRKRIEDIMGQVDDSCLLFLLDHQPFHLEEAEKAGIDLQVSGHTHAGQLFPLNFINRRVYEKYWGYHRRGQTHYYISCGVGTWGPPVQTAARPEIVLLVLKGIKERKET